MLLAVWPTVLVLEFVCFACLLACLYYINVPLHVHVCLHCIYFCVHSVIMSGVFLSSFRTQFSFDAICFHLFISSLVRLVSRFSDIVSFPILLVRSPYCHCPRSHCRAVCRHVSLSPFPFQLDFEFIRAGLFSFSLDCF